MVFVGTCVVVVQNRGGAAVVAVLASLMMIVLAGMECCFVQVCSPLRPITFNDLLIVNSFHC